VVRAAASPSRLPRLVALALVGALGLCPGGCGLWSRARHARDEALRTDAGARVRGRDPLVPATWLVAAARAEDDGRPDDAIARLDEGLAHLPGQPDLVLARLLLLGRHGRVEEAIEQAHAALGADPGEAFAARLRWMLVVGHLERDELDAAARQAMLLAGADGRDDAQASSAWALVALAREEAGDDAGADAAVEHAVRLATRGLGVLLDVAFLEPDRLAPLASLVARARERHPRHPDLLLFEVAVPLQRGDLATAAERLGTLRADAPTRLTRQVDLLGAQLAVGRDDPDAALALARDALDARPTDLPFLAVLVELAERFGVPPADELERRLVRALPAVPPGPLRARIEGLLVEVGA